MNGRNSKTAIILITLLTLVFSPAITFAKQKTKLGCMACHEGRSGQADKA